MRLVSCHSTLRLGCFHCFLLLAFSLHFSSSSAFLRSRFTQSSHLSCGLPLFLQPSCCFVSYLFGNISPFIILYFIHFSTNMSIAFHPPLNYSNNYTRLSSNFFSEDKKRSYMKITKIVGGQPRVANTADAV